MAPFLFAQKTASAGGVFLLSARSPPLAFLRAGRRRGVFLPSVIGLAKVVADGRSQPRRACTEATRDRRGRCGVRRRRRASRRDFGGYAGAWPRRAPTAARSSPA